MSFPITFWYGIRPEFISRERLVEAKEAGFTIIECNYDTKTNLQVLDWCQELGLKANVRDSRMQIALAGEDGWEDALESMIADYKDKPAVNRYFMRDEPVDDDFPTLGRVAQYLHAHDPAHGEYINLLPHPALPQLPHMDIRQRYDLHLDRFIKEIQPTILSYDHYTLTYRQADDLEGQEPARLSPENVARNGWEGNLYLPVDRPDFYDNMELIRRKAKDEGLPWMVIVLLVEHWHYRWPTEGEVRWEAFTALTYGANALSYFTYWTPGVGHTEPWSYHHGIIRSDGTRGEKYEIVKVINAELQTLYEGLSQPLQGEEEVADPHASRAVFHVGDEADVLTKPFVGYGDIVSITTHTGGRAVVGFFGEKGHRMMVTNKDHHAPLTLTIHTDKQLFHLDKTTATWEACDGTYTFAPGDGELFGWG